MTVVVVLWNTPLMPAGRYGSAGGLSSSQCTGTFKAYAPATASHNACMWARGGGLHVTRCWDSRPDPCSAMQVPVTLVGTVPKGRQVAHAQDRALRDSSRRQGLHRVHRATWVRTVHLTVRQLLRARGFVQQVGDPWCHGGGYTAGSVASDSHARSLCCSELPVTIV